MTVIDLLISGGNGLELCRQLKQRSDTPILAISTLDAVMLPWRRRGPAFAKTARPAAAGLCRQGPARRQRVSSWHRWRAAR